MRDVWILPVLWLGALTGCGGGLSTRDEEIGGGDAACESGVVDGAALADLDAEVEARLGLSIVVADAPCAFRNVECAAVAPAQGKLVEAMYRTLDLELGRHSPETLSAYGPTRIVLASQLKFRQVAWEAAGLAYADDRVIYLNVRNLCSEASRRSVIQHELFHLLDDVLFPGETANAAWRSLNPPGFAYRNNYTAVGNRGLHPVSGFVTDYATTNLAEDRADLFAFQVVEPLSSLLETWVVDDRYLAAKDQYLRSLFTSKFGALSP